jgi:DNA (cytosine-5)-methyltransferase 1
MRILDLFCGAGGAAMGLHQAFPEAEITGVDIVDQPNYPFRFVRGDVKTLALEYMDVDFIWAGPVCKRYTRMTNCRTGVAETHPDDIAFVRAVLKYKGKPWVIENVPGSPLINPITLCGTMFGLELYRHRLFEASFPLVAPAHTTHTLKASRAGHWEPGTVMSVAGHFSPVSHAKTIMGIDWMVRDELSQAIPPAYSRYIGEQFKEVNMSDLGTCRTPHFLGEPTPDRKALTQTPHYELPQGLCREWQPLNVDNVCPVCGTETNRKEGESWVALDGGKKVCTNPWHNPKGFERRIPEGGRNL